MDRIQIYRDSELDLVRAHYDRVQSHYTIQILTLANMHAEAKSAVDDMEGKLADAYGKVAITYGS